jgi:hypothetical protein
MFLLVPKFGVMWLAGKQWSGGVLMFCATSEPERSFLQWRQEAAL